MLKNITPLATIHFLVFRSVIEYAASAILRCRVPSGGRGTPVFLVNDSVHNLTFVLGSVEVPLRVRDEAMFIQLPQLVSTNSNALSGTAWSSVCSG